ncbi:MAG: FMN-binding negative transcriptional regulator [Thalassobaculum sp.]|uniref:FMN-binding negative transcriptional regulator n=1 Tax=Thalassobaculum sp. TaxID=2022740 RepID=UPI0032EDBD63
MYIPPAFRLDDRAAALEVMRGNPFALLVVATGRGELEITHLPILVDAAGDALALRGHVSKANPAAGLIAGSSAADPVRATVVFSGAHSYVSPDWYQAENQVPTWNYLAVHAAGALEPVDDPAEVERLLADLSAEHEAALAPKRPWTLGKMAPGTAGRMMKGITAFRLTVDRLEAKAKLSQNKGEADRGGVTAALDALARPDTVETAAWMRRLGG